VVVNELWIHDSMSVKQGSFDPDEHGVKIGEKCLQKFYQTGLVEVTGRGVSSSTSLGLNPHDYHDDLGFENGDGIHRGGQWVGIFEEVVIWHEAEHGLCHKAILIFF
jgi:hypothetical protein